MDMAPFGYVKALHLTVKCSFRLRDIWVVFAGDRLVGT